MNTLNDKKTNKLLLVLAFVAISFIWGCSFVVTKYAMAELEPIEMLAARWTTALVFFGILVLTGVFKVNYKGKPVFKLALVMLLQPCFYGVMEALGVKFTTPTESSIIISAIPIMVVFVGMVIFRKKISKGAILGVVVGFLGIVISMSFGLSKSNSQVVGYLALFGAVLAASIYPLLIKNLENTTTIPENLFMMGIVGCIVFNVLSIATGHGLHPYQVMFSDTKTLLSILYIGIVCGAGGFGLQNYIIKSLPATVAMCIQTNSVAIVGLFAGIILSGDPFGWYTIVGAILTLVGVTITATRKDTE